MGFLTRLVKPVKRFLNFSGFALRLGKGIYFRSSRSRAPVYLGDYRALARTIWGHKMFVDTRDLSLAPAILLNGFWEIWVTKVFRETVKPGMTVVEIGANIGYFTLLAAQKIGPNGKIFAFEANPQVFDILFQNMAVNGFLERVTLVNKAVSDKSGSLKFHKLKRHQGSSSIIDFSPEFLDKYRDAMETIQVEAIALDEFFKDKDPRVDLIKIDAEGSEALIFKKMGRIIQTNPQLMIICEFAPPLLSGAGEDPRKFLEELTRGYGFKLKYIDNRSNLTESSPEELLSFPHCELFLTRKA